MSKAITLTPALIKEIAGCFFDGFNDEDTAFYVGVNVKLISRVRLGEDFPAVRLSVLKRKRLYLSRIRDGKAKGWQRIAWFMERRYPQEFARPEVQLTLGTTTITNNTLVVSAEQAETLATRAKPVKEEIAKLIQAHRPSKDPPAADVS